MLLANAIAMLKERGFETDYHHLMFDAAVGDYPLHFRVYTQSGTFMFPIGTRAEQRRDRLGGRSLPQHREVNGDMIEALIRHERPLIEPFDECEAMVRIEADLFRALAARKVE